MIEDNQIAESLKYDGASLMNGARGEIERPWGQVFLLNKLQIVYGCIVYSCKIRHMSPFFNKKKINLFKYTACLRLELFPSGPQMGCNQLGLLQVIPIKGSILCTFTQKLWKM